MKNKRVGELEEEQLSKLRDGAIKHRKSPDVMQRCFGSVGTELNCQTSSFLDFPLKSYSASLGFCKICLMKGRRNCRGISLLWIVHQKSSQEQNNKRRLQVGLRVTELLNDCSINMFSDELWHNLCLFSFMIL